MKKIFKPFVDGVVLLWMEDMLSFYTFITIVLAECVWLYGFAPIKLANTLIIILLVSIINLVINACIIGEFEGTIIEKISSLTYIVIFGVLFVIACFIDVLIGGMVIIIPLIITAAFLELRKIQNTASLTNNNKIYKLLNNNNVCTLTQIIVLLGPILTLIISICLTPIFVLWLKIILVVLSVICAPLLVYIEDNTAAMDVFEIGFVILEKEEKH